MVTRGLSVFLENFVTKKNGGLCVKHIVDQIVAETNAGRVPHSHTTKFAVYDIIRVHELHE